MRTEQLLDGTRKTKSILIGAKRLITNLKTRETRQISTETIKTDTEITESTTLAQQGSIEESVLNPRIQNFLEGGRDTVDCNAPLITLENIKAIHRDYFNEISATKFPSFLVQNRVINYLSKLPKEGELKRLLDQTVKVYEEKTKVTDPSCKLWFMFGFSFVNQLYEEQFGQKYDRGLNKLTKNEDLIRLTMDAILPTSGSNDIVHNSYLLTFPKTQPFLEGYSRWIYDNTFMGKQFEVGLIAGINFHEICWPEIMPNPIDSTFFSFSQNPDSLVNLDIKPSA